MKSNGDVIAMMDQFLGRIRLDKKAAESSDEIKADSGKNQTEEVDKGDGTSQGAAGSEAKKDVEKALNGETTSAASDAATVKAGDSDRKTDDQGVKQLTADEKVNQATVDVTTTDEPAEDNEKNNKGETGGHDMASQKQAAVRSARLASRILDTIGEITHSGAQQKQANLRGRLNHADNATRFQDNAEAAYTASMQKGALQFEMDLAELQKAGIDRTQGAAILMKVAMEDPEAIMPPEAIPPEVADAAMAEMEGGAPEMGGAPEEEELMAALADSGVTEEQIVQAAELAQQLEEAGVAPEEFAQAVTEMIQEDSAGEEVKEAEHRGRINVLKDYLRGR